jgi:imidazolonepropionase-like amidohydrolase
MCIKSFGNIWKFSIIFPAGLICSLFVATGLVGEETIALTGGRILTMAGNVIEEGTLIFSGDRIKEVSEGIKTPGGARVIDVKGKVVMPGMIDSYTHLGLVEVGAVEATNDIIEKVDPSTPQMRTIDAFNPLSEVIPVARSTGVTTVLCAPGEKTVISGQSALVDLYGKNMDEMVVKVPAGIHVNLGESPKHRWEDNKEPQTRMGIAAILRGTLVETINYMSKWKNYKSNGAKWEKPPSRDLRLEAMVPVLKGATPLIISAHRLDDIETAIRITDEFGIRLILNHATEGYKIADQLAKREIPVLLGPVTTQPSSMEKLGAIYENAALLNASGVKIAIQSSNTHNVRILPYQAGLAAAYGLPKEEALKAITIYPAEIYGVSDDVGSLVKGKVANIVVFDGDPLEPLTNLEYMFIRGREVELKNRQTLLYEKYLRE